LVGVSEGARSVPAERAEEADQFSQVLAPPFLFLDQLQADLDRGGRAWPERRS